LRGWFSVPIVRGIRTGISVNLNPAARVYRVSPTGQKIWLIGSAVMLVGLALWLIFSRDADGRLNENFLLVIFMVWGLRHLFGRAVAAYFPHLPAP
jgi:hypothetical protein